MKDYKSFASFSIDDIEVAKKFYSEEDHKPAEHTVLVFSVNRIEDVVTGLSQKGVVFHQVEGANELGIAEKGPTKSAWFKDPAGNWMAIHEGS